METIAEFLARTYRERQERDAAAAGVVISTVDKNPDQVAGDLSLAQDWAKETGKPMPPMPLVEEYRPVFQQQIEAKRNSTVLSQNPKLAEFLRDPQNAALARDDISGMSYWERVSKSFKMGDAQTVEQGQEFTRDIGTVLERGPLGRGLDALGDAADQLMTGPDGEPTLLGRLANFARSRGMAADGIPRQMVGGEDVTADQRADAIAGASLGPLYEGAAALISEMEKLQFAPMSYKDVDSLGAGLAFISENLAMSLPQMAAAMSSGAFSPLMQVITLGGEANSELKERTDLTEEQRVAIASGAGVVMAGLDYFGLSRIFGGVPAGTVVSEAVDGTLVKRLVKNGVIEAVARTLQAALAEGTTEALQEAIVVGVTAMSGGEYTAEEVIERLAQGFFAGAGAGGAMRGGVEAVAGGGVAARRMTEGDEKARAAAENQEQIAEIAGAAAQSKLRARIPDVFRAWVERATENGPAENLYVPADKFTEYFQSIGMDPWALADEMDGVSRSDLETALATGGDLRIPTATYAARLAGSEADQFFMENMRFDPDEFTSSEARAFEDTKAELMAEALNEAERIFAEQQELRTYEQEIFDTMVERLRMAGRATDVATTEAALYPAFYKVMAERAGIPLGEFIQRYPLPQVRGDIPQGMQAKNVDDLTRTLATARAARQAGVNQPKTPLLEFISNYGGIIDRGGELAARDAAVVRRGRGRKNLRLARDPDLFVSSASAEAGRAFGPDDVAQAAIEAGLMADNPIVQEYRAAMLRGDQVPDLSMALWDEIDRELRGEATMTDEDMNAGPSQDDQIAELERYLGEIGVSLDDDDAVIRQAIERDQAEQRRMYGQDGPVKSEQNLGAGETAAMGAVIDALGAEVIERKYDGSGFGDVAVLRANETDLQISVREDATGVYLTNIAAKAAGDLTEARAGSGVGSAAINALKAYAEKTGKPFAVVGATEPARGFYEKMGMVPADVTLFMDDGYLTAPASGEGGGGFVYRPAGVSQIKTESAAFRRWFGGSKVVDADGEPLVVYHGTRAEFDAFAESDEGIHFGTGSQAKMRNGKRVVDAYLKIENPKRVKDTSGNWKKAVKAAKAAGYDGLVYLNRYEGIPFERFEELRARGISDERMDRMSDAEFRKLVPEASDSYIAFSPTQIKSVNNRGTFDASDPRIMYQGAVDYTVKPPRKLWRGVVTGEQADGSEGLGTFMLGRGLYSSPSKKFAAMYGRPQEVSIEDGWPRNPLVLRGSATGPNLFQDYVLKNSGFRNMREFNAAFPDPADWVRSLGYDGVIAGDEVVKYQDVQDGSRTYGQAAPEVVQPLYVVHNLSADKLRHASDLGGLAAPSIAIARGDIGFDNFGEISLIGDPSMADPKAKGVRAFNADVYSPRQPRARFKVKEKDAQRVFRAVRSVADDLDLRSDMDISGMERDGLSSISANMGIKAAWLRSLGEDIPVQYRDPDPAPVPVAGYEAFTAVDQFVLLDDPAFEAAVQASKDAWRAEREGKMAASLFASTVDRVFDENGKVRPSIVEGAARAVATRNREIANYVPKERGDVDQYQSLIAIDAQIAGREEQYSAWVRSEFGDVIGDAYFEDERGRRRDYTLTNLVREMTRSIRNGENWNYGAGSVRAAVAPEFRNLSEVKAARGQITESDAFGALKDELNSELFALADKFAPYHSSGDSFGWGDIFSEFLKDLAKGPRYLNEWQASIFSEPVPDDLIAEAGAFLEKLKGLPTEYFEIKMQRAVSLGEFKVALVPEKASAETVKTLTDAGVEVLRYGVEGRQAALQRVAGKVFFQPAYHGSPHLFERFSLDKIGTGEGAQAFGWGMYFAGRKEVAEYYRNVLTEQPNILRLKGGDVAAAIEQTKKNIAGLRDRVAEAEARASTPAGRTTLAGWQKQLADNEAALAELESGRGFGRLFEVDIPEDAELLDWDAPLSEQPASVLEKLQPLLPRFTAEDDALLAELGVEVTGEATGANPVLEMTGQQFYEGLKDRLRSDRAASEALRDAGIPGHRYLDGGSRADGDGSRNYVIYDDNRIQVTRFEQEQRGSIAFPGAGVGNGDTVISLFRKADLSTLMHESGHYFLTVLQDMAGKGEASAVAEFETIKAWWRSNAQAVAKDAMRVMPDVKVTEADVIAALDNGTTGNVLLDAAIDVGMQEQFARSFEAYLMEGKAPSVELRGAFEKFRAWLLSVYRSLRGLNVEIDDNIRAVFDRMLATDQEIAEARTQTGDRGPMFTEAPAGMSPEDWARYQAIGKAAQDEAASRLLAETMGPIRREQEAAYRAEKDAVRAEVEPQINARREYRAIEWMGNRRWLGADQPQGLPDMRLDRQALVDRYGEGVLKTLPRGKFTLYANEGGVDPEIAAGLFGFSSADEMILALERAPRRAEAIAAEVEKIMFERHGDPLRDGTVEAKAIEAVHGDKRARMLAIELDVLRAAPGGTKSAVAVFREMARGTLAGMRVRDAMAANRYLTAERKAGEASYRAAANGDMQAAAEAKRRQLLNHMLYTEARKIEAEVEAAEKLAARLQKKSTREKLAGDYLEAIDEILGRYDFRRLSGKAEDRRGALQAYVERMKAEGRENELAIPERILQDAARTPYKRLTVEHLRGVVDSLKNIEHTARLKQKLIDAQSQRDLDAVVDDILGAFDANVKPQPPGRVGTTGERFRAGTRAFLDLVLNASSLLREIDGFKDLGPAFSNLKAPIDAAMNRLQARREKAAMDLDALYGVYTKDERRKMAVRQFVPEIGASLSKWERIAVALNMGNEGNYQRLTDTNVRGGFTEAQVKAIVASLDARDARFVQSVWDYLETFRGDIEAREKRVTGVAPKWVESRPVQIAGIDLRGGYYPLKYDPRLSSLARDDAAQDIAKSLQAGRFGKAQTRNGHLKERATSSGRPVELDISVLHRHVQQVVYDLELSEPVANSWRILQDGRIRDAFVNAGKQADFDALEIWLKDVAEGELRAGDVAGQMARRFKSNFTAAKLAFNLSTVAVQITGVAQSMVVVGKADFLKGVQMALRPGIRDEVHAKSQFMRDRSTTFNKDIFDLYNDPRLGPVASRWTEIRNDWIAPAGFWLMTKVQSYLVDVPTWLAGYQQGLRKFGGDEAKAVAYADDIVKRSQASGIFSDRSAIERGSGSMRMRQNEFLRLFTTLGSYMFAKFNVAYERTGRARQVIEREGLSLRSAQEAVSWTIDVAFLFTLEAVLYAAIKGRLPDEEDDEDDDGMTDEWAAYLAKETALSFMSTIPFVRDIGSVLTGFGGGGAYGAITEELAKPLIQAGQGEVDAALVKSVISATGLFTGLPSGQINRAVDAGWRQAEGDDVSPAEYLLGRIGK